MQASFSVVIPLFALILAGYVFARARIISPDGVKGLGAFVFNLAIPALLFRSMATALPHSAAGIEVIYAYYLGGGAVFALAMLIGRAAFGLDLAKQALMAISATFSNVVLIGIPLVFTAFPREGQVAVMLIVSLHTAVFVTTATVLVEIGSGRGGGIGGTLIAVLKNPLLLAILAGAAWGAAGLAIPAPLDTFTRLLAGAAPPAALFAVGATLAGFRIAGDVRDVAAITALKLVVHPLVVWLLARHVFDLTPVQTAVAVILAALPTGVNPFILAQRYELYVQRAASSVIITTTLSVVTAALLLAWFTA